MRLPFSPHMLYASPPPSPCTPEGCREKSKAGLYCQEADNPRHSSLHYFFFFKHQDAQGGPVLTLNTAFSTAVKIATCYPLIREPSPSLKKRWVIPYLEQHKVDQEGLT